MNDDTLNVVRVSSNARNTPDVERMADDRIAIDLEKLNDPELPDDEAAARWR